MTAGPESTQTEAAGGPDETPVLDDATVVSRSPSVLTAEVDGEVVMMSIEQGRYFGLDDIGSNAIEVYVHRLRKQLADSGASVQIHTIRGLGYLISEEQEPTAASGVRYDDPAFAIAWPIAPTVISERDSAWPDFADTPA